MEGRGRSAAQWLGHYRGQHSIELIMRHAPGVFWHRHLRGASGRTHPIRFARSPWNSSSLMKRGGQ